MKLSISKLGISAQELECQVRIRDTVHINAHSRFEGPYEGDSKYVLTRRETARDLTSPFFPCLHCCGRRIRNKQQQRKARAKARNGRNKSGNASGRGDNDGDDDDEDDEDQEMEVATRHEELVYWYTGFEDPNCIAVVELVATVMDTANGIQVGFCSLVAMGLA